MCSRYFDDYSGIMFDMMLLDKPVFIYANDISEYKRDRNFKFDFEELPFCYAENDLEFIKNIENFSEEIYWNDLKKFKEKLFLYENGTASIKVAKKILEIMHFK